VVTDAKLIADEVSRLRPEVALLDVTMPGLHGLDVARMIREQAPNTKIVFLTMHTNRAMVKEAFRAGASAFVVKNCTASDLVLAVRTVLAGGTYVSPEVPEDGAQAPSEELSERQTSVLRLIAQGCSAKQIACHLNISPRTAEFHKSSIMEKLKLRTTAELTRYAIKHGIT
jgi:DNA-binding NarL/FixJ family response regulator